MLWFIKRSALFLCFSLGTSLWYLLTQAPSLALSLPNPPAALAQEPPPPAAVPSQTEEHEDPLGQTIKFGPGSPLTGYINTRTLVLRESASPSAAVVARLKIGEYESAEILETTRDFLRVKIAADNGENNGGVLRERDYVGWTTWDAIVPSMTAIVLDAETGELVARVPLEDEMDSVTFSPDGSKALFYTSTGGTLAREVQTSDYTHTRTLTSPLGEPFLSPFYGPSKTFHVVAYKQGNMVDGSKASVVEITPDGVPNVQTKMQADDYEFITVSPDGSKVFVAQKRQRDSYEMTVEVIDMASWQTLNTLTLTGTELPWNASSFVLNADGTELYARLSEKSDTISVIDTRTGVRVRELSTPVPGRWFHLFQRNLVGESLLIQTWDNEEDPTARAFWVDGRGAVAAGRGIFNAVEAAGRRYAANEDGTRFFQLDENNGIKANLPIPRPEFRRGGRTSAGDLTVYGLSISPDGKRIILFVGIVHGC